MPITVIGSIAFDTVTTPFGTRERMVGGAATHFALAASFFDEVRCARNDAPVMTSTSTTPDQERQHE